MGETDFELASECDPERPAFWVARIEAALGVPALGEFAAGSAGATRFVQCGEDSPDRVLSCAWDRGGAWVDSVAGFTAGPDGRGEVVGRWGAWLGTGLLPRRLRSWGRVVEMASAAPSCEGEPMIGGPFFYHGFCADGRATVVRWAWPTPGLHRRQCELVGDYALVRLAGWCRSWFPTKRRKAARTERST